MAVRTLAVWDYVILAIMLLISMVIGIYSAFSGGRQRTSKEYLLGDRQMNFVTVGLSIMISFTSAAGLLSAPAEIYLFGTTYWWGQVADIAGALIAAQTIIPIFYRLEVTSIYTYIERRFNKTIRNLCLVVFMFQTNLYNGIVIFTPALALNAVTGLSLDFSIVAIGIVCIFYTSIGGIRAVLWADAFQAVVMILGVVAIVAIATVRLGGFGEVWSLADEGGRIIWFDARFDPKLRSTFWTICIAKILSRVGLYTNQVVAQRCLACSSVKRAQQSIYVGVAVSVSVTSILLFAGIVMYAYYATCDPWLSGQVSSPDQLFPYMVLDILQNTPGLTGIFLASAMSATMSTLSTTCNCIAAVAGESMLKSIWPDVKESVYIKFNKFISFFFGIVTIGIAYLVPLISDGLILLITTFASLSSGIEAVFILGAVSHRVNNKGAFAGIVVSWALLIWLKIGSSLYPNTSYSILPLSVSECPAPDPINATTSYMTMMTTTEDLVTSPMIQTTTLAKTAEPSQSGVIDFYHMTFNLYSLLGFVVSAIVAVIVSWITGFNEPSAVDKELLFNYGEGLGWSSSGMRQADGKALDETKEKAAGKVNEEMELDDIKEVTKN